MQLVIKIPEHYYENNIKKELPICLTEEQVVGILPKNHGRLIDADELQDYFEDNRSKLFYSKDCIIGIDNAPTIIEADKGD